MDTLNETLFFYFNQQGPFLVNFLPDQHVAAEWQDSCAHFLLASAKQLQALRGETDARIMPSVDQVIQQIEDDTTAIMNRDEPFAPSERLCENLRTSASFVLRALPLPTTGRPRNKVVTLYPALVGLPKDIVAAHCKSSDYMEQATRMIPHEPALDAKAFRRAVNVKLAEHLREMSDDLAAHTGQPLLRKRAEPRRARILSFTATP